MSENDGFDDIVKGSDDDDLNAPAFESIMDVIAHFWKDFYPGNIFVKGMITVESVTPEGRAMTLETSSPITDWELLGMAEWASARVKADINTSAWLETMESIPDDDKDGDDDDE